ncbi:hypothetical protein [Sphingomonas sp. Leaf25]|uniref:hypothetical protein n=1 Tax=Sphingomonas sp. Leaf25 TaxID=1735692 RepID=UPI0006F79D7E|nr:hypothetical protein [Sphingomonas sp. Leaf25]KQN07587.1 hypothetical protein ASE78_00125 [Sphingomonas sp. Leaf25]
MRTYLLAALGALLPATAFCQETPAILAQPAATADTKVAADKAAAGSGKQNFSGVDFGIGLSMSYDLGNNDRVLDASIVDGVVRVNRTENIRARVVLELHHFWTPTFSASQRAADHGYCQDFGTGSREYKNCRSALADFGIGPFIAFQPGSDKVIDAIGAGVLVGLRRGDDRKSSFNLGIGVFYDVDAQILGKGFVENQPPPGNETEVRFRRQSQSGLLFLSSYSF